MKKMRGAYAVIITLGIVLAGVLVSPVAPVAAAAAPTGHLTVTVSDSSPVYHANEFITATFTDGNNTPVKGLKMKTTWVSKGRSSACGGVTNAEGVAQCSRSVKAQPGQTVKVLVHVRYHGHTYTQEASFVVK